MIRRVGKVSVDYWHIGVALGKRATEKVQMSNAAVVLHHGEQRDASRILAELEFLLPFIFVVVSEVSHISRRCTMLFMTVVTTTCLVAALKSMGWAGSCSRCSQRRSNAREERGKQKLK